MEPEIVGKRIMELMEKHKISIEELSVRMELNIEKLKNKLNGNEEFFLDEMIKIKEIFNLNNEKASILFFGKI